MTDDRLYAPATLRNRDPIATILADVLPTTGTVLEIASGSGEHIVHFAGRFPYLTFQPSDPDPEALASIGAWSVAAGFGNILPAVQLDTTTSPWPIVHADALLCINMTHIAPWAATEGLIRGAAGCLTPGAPLFLYGPYRRAGVPTAASNDAFDVTLRQHDPAWGLRDLEAVTALATASGFGRPQVTEMPANNLSLVFRRS